jgi:hypothetical protein
MTTANEKPKTISGGSMSLYRQISAGSLPPDHETTVSIASRGAGDRFLSPWPTPRLRHSSAAFRSGPRCLRRLFNASRARWRPADLCLFHTIPLPRPLVTISPVLYSTAHAANLPHGRTITKPGSAARNSGPGGILGFSSTLPEGNNASVALTVVRTEDH